VLLRKRLANTRPELQPRNLRRFTRRYCRIRPSFSERCNGIHTGSFRELAGSVGRPGKVSQLKFIDTAARSSFITCLLSFFPGGMDVRAQKNSKKEAGFFSP